ncbi:MAG: lysine biosynthesis protein LysX [Candidatus Thermoplasmatota archaeon]|jgi:[lysine-biosynthesis-protein LysW]--L-2-aminoadipate ligase|nr:lysine biosynthesis protein LysX [Candidatus Thermoplasmatota archaeon]
MKISMIYDTVRWEEKAIFKAAEQKGIELKMIDVKEMDMDFDKPVPDYYGNVTLQRCTSYYRGLHSTAFLEYKKQKVVNDLMTIINAGNKMLTSLALVASGVPSPLTSVSTSYEVAMKQFSEKFHGRAVLKPVTGSWGRMIALMNDPEAAMAILEDREYMYPLYSIFYMQEYVKRPPRDIRTFVIGERVVGGIYRYQPEGDWRTNAAIGGRAEKCEITPEIEDISIKAAKSVGKGIFGIDIMESERGYLVHEVNSTTEFKNTVRVSQVDIPGEILNYLVEVAR